MSKGRVPQIVAQGDGLRQILIEAQGLGNRAGVLGDLQRMGQPRPVMIAPGSQEHLGLMLQTPERLAVENPVPVPLIDRPDIAGRESTG